MTALILIEGYLVASTPIEADTVLVYNAINKIPS